MWRTLITLGLVWIPAAAADSPADGEPVYSTEERSHWSFRIPERPEVPETSSRQQSAGIRNPVDAFVVKRLTDHRLEPAAPADRRTIVRRLTFDLTGLPPSPEEIQRFLHDPAADAYERLVDRLLGSPAYGERWAQHWLDVIRFAESEGFEYDRHHPSAWRFRDYVIRSFNDDKPFDQFVMEQLAGDEMAAADGRAADDPAKRRELLVAAGFHRFGPVRRNAGNPDVAFSRNEVLTERTDIIGAAFLGLTVGCARCHDHMFDPVRQKDYYRFQAFLATTREHDIPLSTPAEQSHWQVEHDQISAEIKKVKQALGTATDRELPRLQAKQKQLELRLPTPLPSIFSVKNEDPTPIHLLDRGDENKKAEPLGMRALGVLLADHVPALPLETSKPRTRLARWVASAENPLTARVIVNRIWQHHLGRGLVDTPNDFGMNGSAPSHPELLDYLAAKLIRNGWRLKPIHRLIVTSSTYRQTSRIHNPQGQSVDPDNRLLWRQNRRRLSAEEIRDAMLAVSGRLDRKAGGRSVMLPVDPDLVKLLYKPSQWKVTPDRAEHDRRSIYLFAKRNLRLPFMEVFDTPDLQTSCFRRESSTHAPQVLELLNGRITNDLAKSFAGRLTRETEPFSPERLARRAFLLATGRPPSEEQQRIAVDFLSTGDPAEFALALFNLNAFVYVD